MALRRPAIAAIDPNLSPGMQQVLQAMKENIEISNGVQTPNKAKSNDLGSTAWQQRSVTLGMLISLGIISESQALQLYNTAP